LARNLAFTSCTHEEQMLVLRFGDACTATPYISRDRNSRGAYGGSLGGLVGVSGSIGFGFRLIFRSGGL